MLKKFFSILGLFVIVFTFNELKADIIKKIEVSGNTRISAETIKVYGEIELNKDYSIDEINSIIKKLYDTKFFSNISTNLSNGILKINVVENPVINTIEIQGEVADKFKTAITKVLSLKEKGSYIESDVPLDVELIKNYYKSIGYYSAEVEAKIRSIEGDDKRVDLIFSVDKGLRSKIKNIYFTGDKKVKDKRLRDVITSDEAKFWKFLTKNIYLNEERIELDKRLLKNYYLGLGYYNVQILSSRAELKNQEDIELSFSIDAGKRYRIRKISTDIDPVFDQNIFEDLGSSFIKYAGEYYSPFKIQKILQGIDQIIDQNELQFVQHSVSETLSDSENVIDLVFKIFEGPKVQVERVNIKGNNVTNDSVIRSELLVDEGDPYSDVKVEKSIANLKARNIFGKVQHKVLTGSAKDLKIIEVEVEEKPTGEIAAGAGVGTTGTSFMFNIKENNYLGKGIEVDGSVNVSDTALRGGINVNNPNYNYSGNSLYGGINSTRNDNSDLGYENTFTKLHIGTRFEQYDDIYLSPNLSFAVDDLRVDSSASANLKKQAGDFSEFYFGYGIAQDRRDRSFMPTDGYLVQFKQNLPIYADQASIRNSLNYSKYHTFNEDVIGTFKFYSAAINGLSGEDVRLSKRLYIPSRRLRGFEANKIGPRDGDDYVGGNYAVATNFEAALPNILPENTNTDIVVFFDAANLWHADYDSGVGQSSQIRSSVGVASNVYTPIGPLNFVLAQSLSEAPSDTTETFRFQIGTSF